VTAILDDPRTVAEMVDRVGAYVDAGGRDLGQIDFESALQERRGDHEDDEQHQAHVDQRGDVDVAPDLGERLLLGVDQ